MRRFWLTIVILSIGTTVFCALRSANQSTQERVAAALADWQVQTQLLCQVRVDQQQLVDRVNDAKRELAALPPVPSRLQLAEAILASGPGALTNYSAAQTELLLAELGFNWHTTGDYVIISKQALNGIYFDGMNGLKLTTPAQAVLAITPAEKSAIENVTQQLGTERVQWATSRLERFEPGGDVVAKYALPVDEEFSRNQFSRFTNTVFASLGNERAEWFQRYSQSWMQDVGLRVSADMSRVPPEVLAALPNLPTETKPTTLTVKRSGNGLLFTVEQANSTMTTSVSPWQQLPEAFRAVFPGGWQELAQREGFELPKEFQKR